MTRPDSHFIPGLEKERDREPLSSMWGPQSPAYKF